MKTKTVEPFDIRNHLDPEDRKEKERKQTDDDFNAFMNLIADIPFRTLFSARISEIHASIKKRLSAKLAATKKYRESPLLAELGLRRLIVDRFVRSLGDLSPRELYEKPRSEITDVQYGSIIEARAIGLILGCTKPYMNNKCASRSSPYCVCVPQKGYHCWRTTDGACSTGTMPCPKDEVLEPNGQYN